LKLATGGRYTDCSAATSEGRTRWTTKLETSSVK
jgi:hypothetical protein